MISFVIIIVGALGIIGTVGYLHVVAASEKRTQHDVGHKTSNPQSGVGIIYFKEEVTCIITEIETVMRAARVPPSEPAVIHVKRLEDPQLLRWNPSICVLLVEYSERDNIVEQDELGTGSLRKTTMKKLKDMEVKLVVVYVLNRTSETLREDGLYCERLEDTVNKPHFKELINSRNFLSVYQRFTKHQESHLKELLTNTKGGRS